MRRSNARWKILVGGLFLGVVVPLALEPATIRAQLHPPEARKAAPAFSLSDAAGKRVRLSDYRGKTVLLNFWATECGGCILEIPLLVQMDQSYKNDGLIVLGISMDISYENLKNAQEGWGRVKPFVQAHRIEYPVLMGDDQVTKIYDIEALPVSYLIDKSGRIAATYLGVLDKANVEANIKILLRER